ncbi:MAG: two-component system nitrate/nitrite response regulator NarL [Rhodothermales bacterium]|jgi:two-component system nitrate/nitrite response regulator NarL
MIRVLLVDDHELVRTGIEAVLNGQPDIRVEAAVGSGEEALETLSRREVDVVIADQSMPGMSGLELADELMERFPSIAVVTLTMHDEGYLHRELERAGVLGLVLKRDPATELPDAVRAAHAGVRYRSRSITRMEVGAEPVLTSRELEILGLITRECSNRQIADALFISVYTVETHRKNIFRKTGAGSIVGLVNFVRDNGLSI